MVTGPLERRGFLRNVALAVGALLVGIGRSAEGITVTPKCAYCNDSKTNKKCQDPDNPTLKRCPPPSVPLDWRSPLGGRCVECYGNAAARGEAERLAREAREQGERKEPCTFCINVVCGYYDGNDSTGNRSSGQFSYEDPLGVFDSIGAGCYDPVTRETSPWSEPGDACSDLDAQETAPENT